MKQLLPLMSGTLTNRFLWPVSAFPVSQFLSVLTLAEKSGASTTRPTWLLSLKPPLPRITGRTLVSTVVLMGSWIGAVTHVQAQYSTKNNLSQFASPTGSQYSVQVNGCSLLQGCISSSVNNPSNVANNSLTDFATTNVVGLSLLGSVSTSARAKLASGTVSKAGDYAGWVIATSGLVDVNLLSSVTIKTYRAGVFQEQSISGSLLGLDVLGIGGTPQNELAFKTTKDFDEVEIDFGGGLIGVSLFNGTKYYYAFGAPIVTPVTAGNPPAQTAITGQTKTGNAATELTPTGGNGTYVYSNGSGDAACTNPGGGATALPAGSNLTVTNANTGAYTYTAPATAGTYFFCIKVCDTATPTASCTVKTYTLTVTAPCAAAAQTLTKN